MLAFKIKISQEQNYIFIKKKLPLNNAKQIRQLFNNHPQFMIKKLCFSLQIYYINNMLLCIISLY